jgi:hypothetical protein
MVRCAGFAVLLGPVGGEGGDGAAAEETVVHFLSGRREEVREMRRKEGEERDGTYDDTGLRGDVVLESDGDDALFFLLRSFVLVSTVLLSSNDREP